MRKDNGGIRHDGKCANDRNQQHEKRSLFSREELNMNILALDIATKTGWKTKTASGTWDLKPNRGESEGMRVVRQNEKATVNYI